MRPKEINTENISATKPFERFRQFAKEVIAVPKEEIDRREKAYQHQKKNDLNHHDASV
jgi:hypothetical protein